MFCPSCGRELPANATACPWCARQQRPVFVGNSSDNGPLIRAILVTVFCCLPCGVVGIVYACKADSCAKVGDWAGMAQMRQRAKTWTLVGFIGGLLVQIFTVGAQILVALFASA